MAKVIPVCGSCKFYDNNEWRCNGECYNKGKQIQPRKTACPAYEKPKKRGRK